MGRHPNYSGLVVAGVGFFLTRFTVTLAIYEEPLRFYLAGVVPLALGLGLAAFGIALTVADVEPATVRTTALWCLLGAGSMLVLVLLTLVGSSGGMTDLDSAVSQTYLANFLIGGSIGGTLTGLYAARTRRQRDALRQQTNRLVVLNRLLRHEVLNSVAVIRGYAPALRETDGGAGSSGSGAAADREPATVITDRSDAIVETIEDVKHLTRGADAQPATESTPLEPAVETAVERVSERFPDAEVGVEGDPAATTVAANDRLVELLVELLENAIVHGGDASPTLAVADRGGSVALSVRDDGPGLPATQRRLLESGDIEEFDSTGTGFGLNVVRLLVENFGGSIETAGEADPDADRSGGGPSAPDRSDARRSAPHRDDEGTVVTVVLPRGATPPSGIGPRAADLTGIRPALPHLVVALAASLIAGVAFGASAVLQGGSIAGIGFLYGAADPAVGWLTHEFHSVVFGFAYVGVLSMVPAARRDRLSTYVLVGLLWSIVVWVLAASVVAPVWLRLLGTAASVPSFSATSLINHVVWGVSLGALTACGYRYAVPWLSRVGRRAGAHLDALPG